MSEENESVPLKELELEQATLGGALGVLANVCTCYINEVKHVKPDATDDDIKKLHQMCVAVLIHRIVAVSKHRGDMADILEAIAADMREPPTAPNMTSEPLDATAHPD